MGVLDIFRRPPPIADLAALADFLDSRAAFLVQKCMFEYSRARAGVYWSMLFREPEFLDALENARWRGYPIAVADVTEMVEGVLRRHSYGRQDELLASLQAMARQVMRRYPVPPREPETFWDEAEIWMETRLGRIQLGPPKPVKDIPNAHAQDIFDLLPIHPRLRGQDFEFVRNNLRANLCRLYEDFAGRVDPERLAREMLPSEPVLEAHS